MGGTFHIMSPSLKKWGVMSPMSPRELHPCDWVFKHCAVELTPVVTYRINTIARNSTYPRLRALVTPKKTPLKQSFLISYQSHQFSLVSPRDFLIANTCCVRYPLINLPISLHIGQVDLLSLP